MWHKLEITVTNEGLNIGIFGDLLLLMFTKFRW